MGKTLSFWNAQGAALAMLSRHEETGGFCGTQELCLSFQIYLWSSRSQDSGQACPEEGSFYTCSVLKQFGDSPSAPRLSQSLVHIPTHACLARPWGLGLVIIMGNTLPQEQIGCIALPQTTSPAHPFED